MWVTFKELAECDDQGTVWLFPQSSILCISHKPGDAMAILTACDRQGRIEHYEVNEVDVHHNLEAACAAMGKAAAAGGLRTCRVCGCTDDDCSQCVEKTGLSCHWVEDDLCSACNSVPDLSQEAVNALHDRAPREPDGFPAPTGDGMADIRRIDVHMHETSAAKIAREMREGTAVFVSPPKAGLFIFEVRPGEWRVGHRDENGDSTYFDDDPEKASPDLRFRDWPQSLWLNFPTREAAQKAVDDAGLRLADDQRSPADFDPIASAKALLNKPAQEGEPS